MKKVLSFILRMIGRAIPNVRFVRAIPNLLLAPIHKKLNLPGGVVEVQNFRMKLDPNECVDAALWFSPHLYDRSEINFLISVFPKQSGIFVDIGANIGFWSLVFSSRFKDARVIAIEANPNTFNILKENINMNGFRNIQAVNVGVSDRNGILPLYLNTNGNRGGDSFSEKFSNQRTTKTEVEVKTLIDILHSLNVEKIDVMKIDIEGYEERVFYKFFSDAPSSIKPRFICTETTHSKSIESLLQENGYTTRLRARENIIFELVSK